MGSVRDLYTTGDNDAQIEPEQYYRHYLYCDACGSFDLTPWTSRGDLDATAFEGIKGKRRRFAIAALIASPLVVVGLWSALGLALSPVALLALAAGMLIAPVLRGWVSKESAARRWHFVRWALGAIAVLWGADLLVRNLLSPWLVFGGGTLLVLGLLVARALVDANREFLGLHCRRCDATYAYGTPFFTDLDANPRHLTVAEVPRPLGSSPFQRGVSVD